MGLATNGDRIKRVESWRVFVTCDEKRLVAAQTAAAHQLVVVSGGGERLGKQYAALQVVDVVVDAGPQVDDARDDTGILVPHLDAYSFGTCENIRVTQEVDRSTGSTKLFKARNGSRLRRKSIERNSSFAKLRCGFGNEM